MPTLKAILAEQARVEADTGDLTSRGDARRAQAEVEKAMMRLSSQLAELNDRRLAALELPDSLLDAIHSARIIESPRARERQLRIVRRELRDIDWLALRDRVESLLRHGVLPRARPASIAGESTSPPVAADGAWLLRLLGGGAEALESFLAECPNADRTHLRQLIQAVRKAGSDERRSKAEQRLATTIRSLIRTNSAPLP